jgi:WD40 repeat protein
MKRMHVWAALVTAAVAPFGSAQEPVLPVRALAFSPDGQWLVVGRGSFEQKQGDVTVWNMAQQKPIFNVPGKRGIPSVAFSGDGKRLAVASYASRALLLEVPSGKVLVRFPHPDGVRALALTADGKTLVTICRDHKCHVWDVTTGKERYTVPSKEIPGQVSIHPDDRTFLLIQTSGVDAIDLDSGKPRFHLDQGAGSHVYFALFSTDGRWVFTSDNHARVLVWDARDGSRRTTIGQAFAYTALAYNTRTQMMASCAHWYRKASVLHVRLNEPTRQENEQIQKLLAQLDDESLEVRENATAGLLQFGFMVDRDLQLAADKSVSAEVRMRARWIRQKIVDARFAEIPVLPGRPEALAFSPDGQLLACGCVNGWTYVWDLTQKKEIARLRP